MSQPFPSLAEIAAVGLEPRAQAGMDKESLDRKTQSCPIAIQRA